MTNDTDHERAERAMLEAQVDPEAVSPADRQWLGAHLEDCRRCNERAESTELALRSLRSVSVSVSPGLVPATRHRVHAHVQELNKRRSQMVLLGFSCALSWVLGIASAPLVWRAFSWLGKHADLPAVIWQFGFALWWVLPAASVVTVFLVWRAQETAGDS